MRNSKYLQYDPHTVQEAMDPKLYQQAIEEYLNDVKENPKSFEEILSYDGVVMNQKRILCDSSIGGGARRILSELPIDSQ